MTIDSKAIETLRDIHDKTNVPVILVGMTSANSRLKKFSHLYNRISEIVKFEKNRTIYIATKDNKILKLTNLKGYGIFGKLKAWLKIRNPS